MAAPKLSERRVSQRYGLNHEMASGHAVFEKSIALPMMDISYGGFSVALDKPEHESLCETLPKTSEVEVIILGVATTGRAVRVFESKQRLGYAFCHDTASVLIFLRRFIEFMRLGEHLGVVERGLLKPPYDSSDWICLRGDGPTDVLIHKSKTSAHTVDEAVVTFREKDSYRTLEFRNGKFMTSVSSDATGGFAGRSSQETSANEDILRKSACILMGYLQACPDTQQASIHNLLGQLRKFLLSSGQPKTKY
jgi:hypothetical protein